MHLAAPVAAYAQRAGHAAARRFLLGDAQRRRRQPPVAVVPLPASSEHHCAHAPCCAGGAVDAAAPPPSALGFLHVASAGESLPAAIDDRRARPRRSSPRSRAVLRKSPDPSSRRRARHAQAVAAFGCASRALRASRHHPNKGPRHVTAQASHCSPPSVVSGVAFAHDYQLKALHVINPYARATPPGAKIAGAFMSIENQGKEADRLVGATSPAAGTRADSRNGDGRRRHEDASGQGHRPQAGRDGGTAPRRLSRDAGGPEAAAQGRRTDSVAADVREGRRDGDQGQRRGRWAPTAHVH